jgi:hypothetical protein
MIFVKVPSLLYSSKTYLEFHTYRSIKKQRKRFLNVLLRLL